MYYMYFFILSDTCIKGLGTPFIVIKVYNIVIYVPLLMKVHQL